MAELDTYLTTSDYDMSETMLCSVGHVGGSVMKLSLTSSMALIYVGKVIQHGHQCGPCGPRGYE